MSLMIRPAGVDDVAALQRLFVELGYPPKGRDLVTRLQETVPGREVLVAQVQGTVVGVLVWQLQSPLHVDERWGRVSALVVSDTVRSQGVGAALLAAAEQQARAAGCVQLELSSGERRVDAHRFYEREGYEERRKRLVKRWG